jgi:hypothetical protein
MGDLEGQRPKKGEKIHDGGFFPGLQNSQASHINNLFNTPPRPRTCSKTNRVLALTILVCSASFPNMGAPLKCVADSGPFRIKRIPVGGWQSVQPPRFFESWADTVRKDA